MADVKPLKGNEILKAYYEIATPLTDLIIAINGVTLASGISPNDLCTSMPLFFFHEANTNGVQKLCTLKQLDEAFTLTIHPLSGSDYTLDAMPFQTNVLIGGHPIHRPY